MNVLKYLANNMFLLPFFSVDKSTNKTISKSASSANAQNPVLTFFYKWMMSEVESSPEERQPLLHHRDLYNNHGDLNNSTVVSLNDRIMSYQTINDADAFDENAISMRELRGSNQRAVSSRRPPCQCACRKRYIERLSDPESRIFNNLLKRISAEVNFSHLDIDKIAMSKKIRDRLYYATDLDIAEITQIAEKVIKNWLYSNGISLARVPTIGLEQGD